MTAAGPVAPDCTCAKCDAACRTRLADSCCGACLEGRYEWSVFENAWVLRTSELPSFPVDDATLDTLEYALTVALGEGPDGPMPVLPDGSPADMSLPRLLEFLSGPSATTSLSDPDDPIQIEERERPMYSERDVIRALITEVRRLRGENR